MSKASATPFKSFDSLLFDFNALKNIPELADLVSLFLDGDYKAVLSSRTSQILYEELFETISSSRSKQDSALQIEELKTWNGAIKVLLTGLAALNAFLQANVTGPPTLWQDVFPQKPLDFDSKCLKSLDVDGISVYQYIPNLELFCLARFIFTVFFPRIVDGEYRDSKWMRIRINAFHQRLLSGVSAGRLSESALLVDAIDKDIKDLESEVFAEKSAFDTDAKVMFLLEEAQIYILQSLDLKAREKVRKAKEIAGFEYELSGALGKKTKFQKNDISQLVVFAKSNDDEEVDTNHFTANKDLERSNGNAPTTLDLNDDTLLESISFAKCGNDVVATSSLPPSLANLKPDEQPQLKPLDQITLLTEATLKDTLSPLDKLNSEEILPYAVRVLNDKPTNWQIYTQALLVRSQIESHRSRTQERSVLQLQVIVDQIIADTQEQSGVVNGGENGGIPEIKVTSFLPRAKVDESAPVTERLKYIYPLASPTRWEIETELAYAWASAGSFVSALEIFKRLRLWAEVALCYHSVHQEEKARQIVRRQLFFSKKGTEMDKYDVDEKEVVQEKWDGEIRDPSPPHSPRLWCILGDLDQDPSCWEHAWEISKHRYARAQRTLGEYYSKTGDLDKARASYLQATVVNRQNGDTWSRLGDIDLKVGNWDGAIIAFQQSIMIHETDAKTYSNLGSALLSKHAELTKTQKLAASTAAPAIEPLDDEEISSVHKSTQDPQSLLRQALAAYKRGAAIAYTNWQIWDNVITIAGRLSPPSFPDLLSGMRSVIRIRAPAVGEFAVDIDVLRALVLEVTSSERPENTLPGESPAENNGIYIAPRGSLARAVIAMVNTNIIPLITKRAELWALVEKLSLYRKDYANALSCAEKAWRMLKDGEDWLLDEERWKSVVSATDNLVSAFENYGPMEMVGEDGETREVEKSWRMKARNAVRGVMSKGKEVWEGGEEWEALQALLEGLKS
ncbi:TPR-like protein [Mollisia scopiformis]|uniref:TPR-like protein n=1 Tax=Mollisia scopiformis TaxID=149040 RepID=A0A194X7N1_MOLSC|nr:TPR-like protein [Mollisia scopiformis]KUJ16175.1 TPR-like protein [Mollisia scopiformis]